MDLDRDGDVRDAVFAGGAGGAATGAGAGAGAVADVAGGDGTSLIVGFVVVAGGGTTGAAESLAGGWIYSVEREKRDIFKETVKLTVKNQETPPSFHSLGLRRPASTHAILGLDVYNVYISENYTPPRKHVDTQPV